MDLYVKESFENLNIQQKLAISLEFCRKIVPLLYDWEEYVAAKLIEVPVELCLEFLVNQSLIFNRVYGCIDPLMFKAQEKDLPDGTLNCLAGTINAVLSCCWNVHDYHMLVEGGDGPPYDCYLAEAGEDTPVEALLEIETAISKMSPQGTFNTDEWLRCSILEITETSVSKWIISQAGIPIPYPFRVNNA